MLGRFAFFGVKLLVEMCISTLTLALRAAATYASALAISSSFLIASQWMK